MYLVSGSILSRQVPYKANVLSLVSKQVANRSGSGSDVGADCGEVRSREDIHVCERVCNLIDRMRASDLACH